MPQLPNFREWPERYEPATTRDLVAAYARGFAGAIREPEEDERLDAMMEWKSFGDAAYDFGLVGTGEGGVSTLYKAVAQLQATAREKNAALPQPWSIAQKRGDCVSWGTHNACDATRAVEIVLKKEPESWENITAAEPCYLYRGHSGEGASCSRIAQWVTSAGGMLLRRDYTAEFGIDLTNYNQQTRSWSSNGSRGPDERTRTEAKKHPIRTVTRVTSVEECRDALANGYGVNCCSGYGFSSRRDENGIAQTSGSWAHAMAWLGCDDSEEARQLGGPLFLVQNSWGYSWISGPKRHDQPEGSFWITAKVAAGMIRSGGTFAFSDAVGFPRKRLDVDNLLL